MIADISDYRADLADQIAAHDTDDLWLDLECCVQHILACRRQGRVSDAWESQERVVLINEELEERCANTLNNSAAIATAQLAITANLS